jgi:THO complex subunit 1
MKLIQPGKALNKTVLYQYTVSEEDVSIAVMALTSCANLLYEGQMGGTD